MRLIASAIALVFCLSIAPSLAKNLRVVVNGLDDLKLGTWTGSGPLEDSVNLCVGTSPKRPHEVVLASQHGPNFIMRDGAARLPYRVYYDDGTGGWQSVEPVRALADQKSASLPSCRSKRQQNQKLRISVSQEALAAAPAGDYSDTLVLTVRPE